MRRPLPRAFGIAEALLVGPKLSVAGAVIATMTTQLTRLAISEAVFRFGWRLILARLETVIAVPSMTAGAPLVERIVARCVPAQETVIRFDLRPRAVLITIEPADRQLRERDVALARAVSAAAADLGLETSSALPGDPALVVQGVEFAIDAVNIDAVRPFGRAVLGYVDAPDGSLHDPAHRGFPVWLQSMDQPRTQRNRVHFDVVVAHDVAQARVAATLAAGGTLRSAARAPAFWILADAEGNEVCVCTWQGRDAETAPSTES